MANPGTRFNKVVSVGAPLASFASLAATIMLFVFGNIGVQGEVQAINVASELTATGSTSTRITTFRADVIAMRATGALALVGQNGEYPQFRWQNPKTQSAAVLTFCLDIFTTPSPATNTSCWINNEETTGSGGATYLFKNQPLTRGTLCYRAAQNNNSGAYLPQIIVGPDEHIKCGNSAGSGSGQGLVGDGVVNYRTMRL